MSGKTAPPGKADRIMIENPLDLARTWMEGGLTGRFYEVVASKQKRTPPVVAQFTWSQPQSGLTKSSVTSQSADMLPGYIGSHLGQLDV